MSKNKAQKTAVPEYKRKLFLGIFFFFIAVVALILIFVLPDAKPKAQPQEQYTFTKEGTGFFSGEDGKSKYNFDIEIAEDNESRNMGLMYRETMQSNQAMLFIFDQASVQSFWMKNTYIPLDIIFIGADSTIVSISENTTPFSEESVISNSPALFALEVNAGICKKHNLIKGDKLNYKRD